MSGFHQVSEDELNDLTPEERAAIEAEGDDDLGNDNDNGEANNGGNSENGTPNGEDAGAQAGKNGNNADAGNNAGGADDAGNGNGNGDGGNADDAADDANVEADRPAPLLIAQMPENAEARLKEFGDKKAALVDQFENGDITGKEYQTQLDALNKDERQLERDIDKAKTAAELNEQQERNAWESEVKRFTSKDHPEYHTSQVRWGALDMFVKQIAAEEPNLSGPQLLAKAHAKVVADLGEAPKAKGKQDEPSKGKKDGEPMKGSKNPPPRTLRDVPAADNNELGEGKYAALDRLRDSDPEAHEEKLMKMSESERDAYLGAR